MDTVNLLLFLFYVATATQKNKHRPQYQAFIRAFCGHS